MLPSPRLVNYGNIAATKPKVRYNFDLGVNQGTLVPNIAAGSYYSLPTNTNGYTKGIINGQLSFTNNYNIGLKDYSIEATFYAGSTVSTYSVIAAFGNTGIRFGDNGFGDRLQFSSFFGTLNTVYNINVTKNSIYRTFHTIKMERISNVLKVYYDGVQVSFAAGTGNSYVYNEVPDNYNIPENNIFYCGAADYPVVKVTFDFK